MRKERNHPRLEYVTDVHPRLHFCRAAALLRLKGGLDKLVCRDGNHERYELCLDGRTLADAHIPGCGNCGTLMRRGYGDGLLSQEECQAVRDRINDGYDGLKAATAYLAPFVGLMASGLYIAADFDLFPVMNYGRLHEYFWESPEYNSELHSTHVFVGGGAEKLDAPMYLTPTQRAALINPARVEEYRRRLQEGEAFPRAVAMYLNGGVALLLDGHHKAVACALEGIPVRTLVIFRIEDEQTVKTAMEAGKRLYLHHSKALYRSADTLILRDGQGNELTRMSCLERMKRKKVEKAETEDVPWGELPEEYRTEAYGKFPNAGRLSAATLIPPDQLRSTIEEEMRKPQGRHDMKVVSHLLWYAEMFPESKWLSAEERAWLARPWHEF
ncbi:MAG: hypothetical protein IJ343_14395 [Clostridia bacterium]|nr:hypothetical protein [Clostridia bacterium]